jgi:hypothetical protein
MNRREMLKLSSVSAAAGLGFVFSPSPATADNISEIASENILVDQLASDFSQPPSHTRPWCYWYWVSNYISREGITRDLEAMKRVGIGQAMMANIAGRDTPLGDVKLFSELWWSLLEHAIREAKRIGIDIGIFNGPGWSQSGGPWITPARTMRYVVSSEMRVKGPAKFEGKLPMPKEPFQDVGVLAFPVPRADADEIAMHSPQVRCSPAVPNPEHLVDGNLETNCLFPTGVTEKRMPFIVDIEVAEPFTARSLELHPIENNVYVQCELRAADAAGIFKTVRIFDGSTGTRSSAVQTHCRADDHRTRGSGVRSHYFPPFSSRNNGPHRNRWLD